MKKIYLFFMLLFAVTIAQAQWAGYNGNGTDNLWSNDANWAFGGGATSISEQNLNISFYNGTSDIDLDENYTSIRLRMPATKAESFNLNGVSDLILDVNNADNTDAILHETTAAQTLTINTNTIISNSLGGQSIFNIVGNAGNVIEFSPSSTLHLNSTGLLRLSGNAMGEFQFNGTITGSQGIMFDVNSTTKFGSTSDVSSFTGTLTFQNAPNVTMESTGTIITTKIQSNGSGGVLTLKSANVVTPNEVRIGTATKNREFTINADANQTFKAIKMAGTSTFNLGIGASVTQIAFDDNTIGPADWGTSTLNITGYREGVVKFGDNASGLSAGQLTQITIDGVTPGPGDGDPLSLDVNGYLVGAENLALSVKDYNAFEFAVYPNPANDMIRIQTEEIIESVEVFDLLGRKVAQPQVTDQIDINNLNTGMYMVKLTAENGGVATKRIIKK